MEKFHTGVSPRSLFGKHPRFVGPGDKMPTTTQVEFSGPDALSFPHPMGTSLNCALRHHTLICPRRNGECRQPAATAEHTWQARIHTALYPDSLWYGHIKIT